MQQEYSAAGGIKSLADILNHADRSTERNVLDKITETDESLGAEVRRLLFIFEDITKLDDRSIQLILREADQKDLALALRGVADEVKDRILANMSERGAQMLVEEMEFQPPQRKRDIEEAQGRVVAIVRKLEEAGAVVLRDRRKTLSSEAAAADDRGLHLPPAGAPGRLPCATSPTCCRAGHADAEQIRQQARAEGEAEGRAAGLAAARAELEPRCTRSPAPPRRRAPRARAGRAELEHDAVALALRAGRADRRRHHRREPERVVDVAAGALRRIRDRRRDAGRQSGRPDLMSDSVRDCSPSWAGSSTSTCSPTAGWDAAASGPHRRGRDRRVVETQLARAREVVAAELGPGAERRR